jgi:cytochrome c5
MKTVIPALATVLLLSALCLRIAARPQTSAEAQRAQTASHAKAKSSQEGERRFQANCGRCHNPPDSLSPREVKAVLQHMRVRAMLSAEDERLILKYLAP